MGSKINRIGFIVFFFTVIFVSISCRLVSAFEPGSSIKSFISPTPLDKYEIGFSTTYRDTYGKYNSSGKLIQNSFERTYSVSFGGGINFWDNLQSFIIVPFEYHTNEISTPTDTTSFDIGDITLGGRWILIENIFYDPWLPKLMLFAGAKIPAKSQGSRSPPTETSDGDSGLWKPYIEVGLVKDFKVSTLALNANYTTSLGTESNPVKSRDRLEIRGSIFFPLFNEKWNLGGGASEQWVLTRSPSQSEQLSPRRTILFFSSNYYFSRSFQLQGSLDWVPPLSGMGVNDEAIRTVSMNMKYGFP